VWSGTSSACARDARVRPSRRVKLARMPESQHQALLRSLNAKATAFASGRMPSYWAFSAICLPIILRNEENMWEHSLGFRVGDVRALGLRLGVRCLGNTMVTS
jgi:hypothetical protein